MKKFMKVCAIIAAILIGVGVLMTFLGGAAVKGKVVSDVLKTVTDGFVEFRFSDGDFGFFINEEDILDGGILKHVGKNIVVTEDGDGVDINFDFDSAYDIFGGDVEKYEVAEEVLDLKIMAGGCKVSMLASEDDSFYAQAEDVDKFQCYTEDDCLYVKTSQKIKTWDSDDSGVIMLYVPEGYVFENVDMELGAGQMIVEDVNAKKVDLEVGAGQIVVNGLQADDCKIKVGMGEVIVTKAQANTVDAEVGMGELEWEGSVLEKINGECSMGAIGMVLPGSEEDYDYKVSVSAGSVTIGSTEYSGVGQKKTVNNDAGRVVDLDCAMGEIRVEFEE